MRPRIFLVDDEPDFETVARAWLEPAFDCCALKDGDELAGALRAGAPDLVILDLNLPGEDGFEVCRRLRATPGLGTVPVLFVTGSIESRARLEALASDDTSYLMKPVVPAQLVAAVRGLIEGAARGEHPGGD
ncbi:MAG: response regulator transcription factor [Elusimicrobia bacterium]|nr:response regulator transcription factor [Elusimicrobiota bacterium]